ncbi:MAG: ATP-binding protein [Candidatus Brocadiaceae bacterium]|nr:ATP-binding protein [Candidatus Brocadiaceae bacterium]
MQRCLYNEEVRLPNRPHHGLPGAGKTTLGKKLSAKYHLPVFYIGAYREEKNERGGEWLFSNDYCDKYEFVRKMFRQFIDVPGEMVIDTTRMNAQDVFRKVVSWLPFWKDMGVLHP